MLADRRLTQTELVRNKDAADAVVNKIAVGLPRKVRAWILEPFEDLQAPVVRKCAQPAFQRRIGDLALSHIANLP